MTEQQRKSINTWANDIYERAGELGKLPAPEVEAAVQAVFEAADQLSFLTCEDVCDMVTV